MGSSETASARRPTRRERKAATRAAVLAAADRCLAERGYDGTTVADIAREAGVAHGTVYVHFESKDAVVDALVAGLDAELAGRLAPLLAGLRPPPRLRDLRLVAGAFLDLLVERRGLVQAWASRAAASAALSAARDGVSPAAFSLLSSVLGAAGGTRVRLDLATHGILGMWLRVGLRHALGDDIGREEAVEALARMTAGALGAVLQEVDDA